MDVMRATENWQRAGAYYVRIQAMAKKHHITLPEYRHQGIGTKVIRECERWALELGYQKAMLESRDNKIPFYRQMGYKECGEPFIEGETFRCIRMEKELKELFV